MEMQENEATDRGAEVQAGGHGGCHAAHSSALAVLLALLLLSACAHRPDTANPVTWWHELQGGAIAEQRPPPPGADLPYPKLVTVPPKPAPTDPASRRGLSSALLQDRTNAEYIASLAPIALPPRPPAPPKPGAADPDASTASLEAAQAPPQTKTQAKPPSPRSNTEAAAIPADGESAPPSIPETPPAPPVLGGVHIGATTPAPPPNAPPATHVAVKPSDAARAPVPVAFATGSAVLPPDAVGPLKQLASRRASAAIDILGFGEATDTQPQLQTAGITLGLARAHAIAAALIAAGVPANSLRIEAQAMGRGGDARLVD